MITAWHALRDEIREAERKLGNPLTLWYRGHEKSSYELVPSLYRYANGIENEKQVFDDFISLGGRGFIREVFKVNQEIDEDWSTLFDMQHYQIPTRLLDWSESLAVALAFAILTREESTEPSAIFVLDPILLNQKVNPKRTVIAIDGHGGYPYKELYWEGRPTHPERPTAIAPPAKYFNDRMAAQRSVFTVHGSDTKAIDVIFPDVVAKVDVPPEAIEGVRQHLEKANISAATIFPDPSGVAQYIRRKYGFPRLML